MSSDMNPAARRVLERAKAAQPRAPEGMRERVRSAVLEAVAHPNSSPGSEAGAARSSVTARWLAKPWFSVTLLMLSGLGLAGVMRVTSSAPPPKSTAPDPERLTTGPEQPPPGVPSSEPLAPAAPSQPSLQLSAASPERETSAAPAPDLRAEMAWLARAEAALRKRDPSTALRELEAQRARFEQGQLRAEREGLELIARCMLGRSVSPALASYLASAPDGVLVARVQRACRVTERR